ncbi:shikimate dehydrogenase [Aestuariibacter halophilus]|uniref:Shikimate dehydrogenase (NADP(+)) n=1 Tax=Fluctibacter halophilus TaxID=226011 RepID=A0ABS8G8P7_9ALTE|nr:shikimate dehydrogenase [Aestuariibacter halophilus]MCC2616888.1 shikimate dehydrogenase [Aestuariibacter halophilus]
MDHYAVIGHPIGHSKSPLIHRLFAEQTGQTLEYEAILSPLDGFAETLQTFFSVSAAKGVNVTVPFKEQAFEWVDSLSPAARQAGAVNTIVRRSNGEYLGDNTDGMGLVLDLRNKNAPLTDAHVMVVGAGGAARGVLLPLYEAGVRRFSVVNRTLTKAKALAQVIPDAQFNGFDYSAGELEVLRPDIIINATSLSLSAQVPPLPLSVYQNAAIAYDMVYQSDPTVFMNTALANGTGAAYDGLGMLVGQAAYSFFLWRGVHPDITPVLSQLRSML